MDTKLIKQKILDLAIRGKLVPQNPADEPASVLLERIKAEKAQLIKEGKIKKEKPLAPIEEVPFEIPESWEWCRINEITSILGDGLHGTPKYDDNGPYYFVNGNNLLNGDIIIKDNTQKVSCDEYNKYKKPLTIRTILVSINGTIGNFAVYNNEPIILGKSACFFDLLDNVDISFICRIIESNYFLKYAIKSATGSTIKNVPLAAMRAFNLPLPPLAEQKRIVAEIDRWFKWIDELEQNQQDLHTAIKQAKSKILDLAIHGKLVPQESEWKELKVIDLFEINPKITANDELDSGFVPMALINDGFKNSFTYETRKWSQIKKGYTPFQNGDIAVAKISPCLENRKSMILKDLPNGIGSGTTELFIFRSKGMITAEYGLCFFKSKDFISNCVGTFNGVVGQQRVARKIIEEMQIRFPISLTEQIKIVSKIEKLFAQLDRIEQVLY